MKELSVEEKAKHYDEVIERAKNFIENGDERERTIAESIFAGIMDESEDERIRKELIELVKETHTSKRYYNLNKMLAWLEKQGEQKPKFRVGDTITDPTDNTFTFHINAIKDGKYMESDKDWVLIKEADNDYELVEQKPAEEYNITGISSKKAQGKLGKMIKNLKRVNKVLKDK